MPSTQERFQSYIDMLLHHWQDTGSIDMPGVLADGGDDFGNIVYDHDDMPVRRDYDMMQVEWREDMRGWRLLARLRR